MSATLGKFDVLSCFIKMKLHQGAYLIRTLIDLVMSYFCAPPSATLLPCLANDLFIDVTAKCSLGPSKRFTCNRLLFGVPFTNHHQRAIDMIFRYFNFIVPKSRSIRHRHFLCPAVFCVSLQQDLNPSMLGSVPA